MRVLSASRRRRLCAAYGSVLWLGALVVALGTGCPTDSTPPGNVAGLTAIGTNSRVDLIWTNPTDADFGGVRIQRATGAYPASPVDGTTVYDGKGASASDVGLQNGARYLYAAFAYDGTLNYASGARASAIPTTAMAHEEILEGFQNVRDALTGPGANGAPADQLDALSARLENAEKSYRGGDPCGAANHLLAYQEAAQADRQSAGSAAIMGVFEELYNLGRRLRYDMLANTSSKDLCPGQERLGMLAGERVDDSVNDNTQLKLTFTLGEPKLNTLREGGEVFTQVNIPERSQTGGPQWGAFLPGQPAAPVFRRLVGVPRGAEVSVESSTEEAETFHCNLAPVRESPVDAIASPAPSAFADPAFLKDAEAYATDALWPSVPCRLIDAGQMRDLHVVVLDIAAGQYNPKTQVLTLFKQVDVHLVFHGGAGFLTDRSLNAFEGNPGRFTGVVVNRSAVLKYIDTVAINPSHTGEEFMILTPPLLLSAAQTLQTWKNQKGIPTSVFQIGPGTDHVTNTQIQEVIREEFSDAGIRPSYVLLLGDADLIPPFYVAPNGNVGSATIATDYPYASLSGLSPILPDVALGRIPVSTLADATTVVNKIIRYEKTPPGLENSAFYAKALIASGFQCCRTDGAAAGMDQRTFIESTEFARNALINEGYLVDRVYEEIVDPAYSGSSVPARYYNGTLLPLDIGGGSGFGWDGPAGDIGTAINSGRFLVIHRDHGWPDGWITPRFDTTDALNLLNGDLLPVVFSVNCASGYFDGETSDGALGVPAATATFAEALLRNPNGGAVGVLGCTRNSPSWANSALLRGFIDAIWPNAIPGFGDSTLHRRLGDILNHGKLYLFTQGNTSGAVTWGDVGDEFRLWHCIGDPTLAIWTQFPYAVVLPATLNSTFLQTGLKVEYPIDGAEITALQTPPSGGDSLVAIGRGVVQDGVATFDYVNAPDRERAVQFSVNLEGTVARVISLTPAR